MFNIAMCVYLIQGFNVKNQFCGHRFRINLSVSLHLIIKVDTLKDIKGTFF